MFIIKMAFIYLTPSTSTRYSVLKYFSLALPYFQKDVIVKGEGEKRKKRREKELRQHTLN